jgi:hypothetical protein
MTNEELKEQVFKDLINKQLEPFGETFESIKDDHEWFLKYPITKEQEDEFIKWGVKHLCKKLKITRSLAEQQMNWFILDFGLITKL